MKGWRSGHRLLLHKSEQDIQNRDEHADIDHAENNRHQDKRKISRKIIS